MAYGNINEGVIVISKIMILSFSDAEECVLNRLKSIIPDDIDVEHIEFISESILTFGNLKVSLEKQEVYQNGKLIPLSKHEFLALRLLTEHPGWVCTRDQIYEAVYGELNIENIDNSIYCIIHSLRKKIEKNLRHPQYIQTVRGIGYKFLGNCNIEEDTE